VLADAFLRFYSSHVEVVTERAEADASATAGRGCVDGVVLQRPACP
jgi:hypothetical protein